MTPYICCKRSTNSQERRALVEKRVKNPKKTVCCPKGSAETLVSDPEQP